MPLPITIRWSRVSASGERGLCSIIGSSRILGRGSNSYAFGGGPRPAPLALDEDERDERGDGERSEEHTYELQSLMRISYAVFCLKKKKALYNNHYSEAFVNHEILGLSAKCL